MASASVNANTLRADCGLLPNLTCIGETENCGGSTLEITASMSGVGEVSLTINPSDCEGLILNELYCTN